MKFEQIPIENKEEGIEAELESELDAQEERLSEEIDFKKYGPLAKMARKLVFTSAFLETDLGSGFNKITEKTDRP